MQSKNTQPLFKGLHLNTEFVICSFKIFIWKVDSAFIY